MRGRRGHVVREVSRMVTMVMHHPMMRMMRTFLFLPLLRQIAQTATLPALVTFRRVELLRKGPQPQEFLAAFAPLEVNLRLYVLPRRLVAILADVLVLPGNDAILARR